MEKLQMSYLITNFRDKVSTVKIVAVRTVFPFFKKRGKKRMKSYCKVEVTSFAALPLFKNHILQSLFYKTV